MRTWHLPAWVLSVGAITLGVGVVSAQDYPTKPIRVFTALPGGGSDLVSRLIAQGISAPLGQQVIVENRPGGIGPEAVAKSAADGYTLLYYGAGLWLLPLMRSDVPYDAVRDFVPITLTNIQPSILAVHPSLPVKNVKELITLASARPGQLNYSSGGPGSAGHLAGELFKSMAKVNVMHIPYKAQGPANSDVVAGHIQLTFGTTGGVVPFVKSGRLKALAVTTAQPSALVPGLPTIAASGLPGYESAQISGLHAPAKTPAAIVSRLNQEAVRFLTRPDIKEKLASSGVEVVASTPEEFANKIRSEITRMGKVIKDANIREQ